jgi:hypothetical protein
MTTALDVITDAFNKINENEAEAPIENFDAQLALRELNRMMAALRLDVGWYPASALTSTLSVDSDVEDYIVYALAKRLCADYEIPVSAPLESALKDAKSNLFLRYVKIGASNYHPLMPREYRTGNYGYNADYNGLDRTRKTKTVKTSYTVTVNDDLIYVDCGDGPVTLTFPAAASCDGYGWTIEKIDESANQVILSANGSELIYGDATYRFNEYQRSVEVVSDGTQLGGQV